MSVSVSGSRRGGGERVKERGGSNSSFSEECSDIGYSVGLDKESCGAASKSDRIDCDSISFWISSKTLPVASGKVSRNSSIDKS